MASPAPLELHTGASSAPPTETLRPSTPRSLNITATPLGQPVRLKRRQRLVQGLQRISSSPSLAKLARNRSSEKVYRSGHKASISCISLGSPSSVTSSSSSPPPPNYFPSTASNGYSTAPTTPGTPGSQQSYFDAAGRPRPHETHNLGSLPSNLDLRLRPSPCPLTEIPEKPLPKRPNFNFWADLPPEIRVQIFSYLSPREMIRLSSVSRAWHDMCFDGQLWANLDCQSYYQQITSEALIKILLRAGAFVKNLNLRGCVQLRDQWLSLGTRMTNQECRNLETFSIEGCKIERSSIHFFLLRNPNLMHLNMPSMQNINNATMKIIAAHCPRLELLNIDWCSQIDTRGLKTVVQSCPNLTDLRASEIRGLDENDFVLELFRRNKLERLFLQHCDSLTDEALQTMMHGPDPDVDVLTGKALVPPRRLRHLDISRCRNLTDAGVKSLARNLPFLEGLRMCQNSALTDDSFLQLLPSTPRLTHLEVEEVDLLTNTVLTTLAQSPCAHTLEHLSVSYCELIGDAGVLPLLKSSPQLTSLCVDNTRISDLVLMEASEQVRKRGHLTRRGQRPKKGLDLIAFDCANVTWAGVREVLQGNCRVMQGRKKSVVAPQPAGELVPASDSAAEPPDPSDAESSSAQLRREIQIQTLLYPAQTIHLKAFYGWQQTVEEHYQRCMAGRWGAAARLEGKWAEWMVASEEVGVVGHGWSSRRRRRRAREAEARVRYDEENGGGGGPLTETGDDDDDDDDDGSGWEHGGRRGPGRRRARSGGCRVM